MNKPYQNDAMPTFFFFSIFSFFYKIISVVVSLGSLYVTYFYIKNGFSLNYKTLSVLFIILFSLLLGYYILSSIKKVISSIQNQERLTQADIKTLSKIPAVFYIMSILSLIAKITVDNTFTIFDINLANISKINSSVLIPFMFFSFGVLFFSIIELLKQNSKLKEEMELTI